MEWWLRSAGWGGGGGGRRGGRGPTGGRALGAGGGGGDRRGDRGPTGEQQLGPVVAGGEVEHEGSRVVGEASGGAEQSQPELFGFPAPRRVLGVAERLGPGQEFAGQLDDGAPDAVVVEPVQRQILQAGVLGGPDAVLAAGPATVAQFEVGELGAGPARAGVGDERGDPVAVV